jgi:hypothetical protein
LSTNYKLYWRLLGNIRFYFWGTREQTIRTFGEHFKLLMGNKGTWGNIFREHGNMDPPLGVSLVCNLPTFLELFFGVSQFEQHHFSSNIFGSLTWLLNNTPNVFGWKQTTIFLPALKGLINVSNLAVLLTNCNV